MINKLLVGITGAAGCGKDTAAEVFVKHFHFKKYSFATPIKDAVRAMFPSMDLAHLYGDKKEEEVEGLGVSARYMLQTLGTEWGRGLIHPDIWLEAAISFLERSGKTYMVIPDVRFDNEAKFIRENDGVIIRVIRKDAPDVLEHASELGITSHMNDYVVQNNGTIEELHKKIRCIAEIEINRWILEDFA